MKTMSFGKGRPEKGNKGGVPGRRALKGAVLAAAALRGALREDPDIILDEIQRRKDLISQGIIHILSTQKLQQKVCHSCKKHLPWNWPYRLCDSCYRRHNSRGGRVFIPDYYNLND